ncbi:MAG: sigma-70 family RNA polymerase sigma factor [bacterium]|nr:sigma-70 family RNA polymerase sigma factor [bacterium]
MSKNSLTAKSGRRAKRASPSLESMFSLKNSKREKPVGNLLRYFGDLNRETVFTKEEAKRYSFIIFSYKKTFHRYRKLLLSLERTAGSGRCSGTRLRALKKASRRMYMFYRNFFVEKNLRLVVFMAKSYSGKGIELEDLIQHGNMGLMRSLRKFDPRKGFTFSTYALWWIRQCIIRGFVSDKLIKIPAYIIERSPRIRKAIHELQDELGRNPTELELAERAKIKVPVAKAVLQDMIPPLSLDVVPSGKGDARDGSFMDILSDFGAPTPETVLADLDMKDAVRDSLLFLSPRERAILSMRYGLDTHEPETLDTIGTKFKLTRERIRQIEKKALRTLFRNDKIKGILASFMEGIDYEEGIRVSYLHALA